VVPARGVAVVTITLAGLTTATPGIESGVVVVVVVVTERVGAAGGSDETWCDSGSEAQPARMPRLPQAAMRAANRRAARRVVE
jgi:cobalamin biosynthesis protein CobT